jgi:hypothetical protein
MFAKCSCQHCGGGIEFDVDGLQPDALVECPHCKLETVLFTPPPAPQPQIEQPVEFSTIAWSYVLCFLIPIAGFFFGVYLMAKKKSGHGAACMAISIVLVLGWLAVFSKSGFTLFDKQRSILENLMSADAQRKPDENLKAVQGAYGWNLGDVLPNNFGAKTNNDSLGITSGFDISGLSGSVHGWLTLTEDRRIAAIYIFGLNNDQGSVNKMLKEKYGFRKMSHYSSGGDYNCYFGTTNRQAVLNSFNNSFSLEYRDEELCQLAEEQTKNRKAAAQKQIEDELKTHL